MPTIQRTKTAGMRELFVIVGELHFWLQCGMVVGNGFLG